MPVRRWSVCRGNVRRAWQHVGDLVEEGPADVYRQREDHGGVVVCSQLEKGLQVTQLDRGGALGLGFPQPHAAGRSARKPRDGAGQRPLSRRLRCRDALRCPPRTISPNMIANIATRAAKPRPTPKDADVRTGPSASTVRGAVCPAKATRGVITRPILPDARLRATPHPVEGPQPPPVPSPLLAARTSGRGSGVRTATASQLVGSRTSRH